MELILKHNDKEYKVKIVGGDNTSTKDCGTCPIIKDCDYINGIKCFELLDTKTFESIM